MQFTEVRLSRLLRVIVGSEGKAKSARFSAVHPCVLRSVALIVALLALSATGVIASSNPAADLQAQVCPMLDDLTEASISMIAQDRSSASTQIGAVESLADTLLSTVQSPDMMVMLGKSSKMLQKEASRFQGRIAKRRCGWGT